MHLLWSKTDKNLIRPKITKVGYFTGVHQYFSAVSGMNRYFEGLFWHAMPYHIMPAKNYCAYSGYWHWWRCSNNT